MVVYRIIYILDAHLQKSLVTSRDGNLSSLSSSQDRGLGRHTLPPCTTIRKIKTNFKTRNTQNCQKIELFGSLTTEDLKKSYSRRRLGRSERTQCGGGEVPADTSPPE